MQSSGAGRAARMRNRICGGQEIERRVGKRNGSRGMRADDRLRVPTQQPPGKGGTAASSRLPHPTQIVTSHPRNPTPSDSTGDEEDRLVGCESARPTISSAGRAVAEIGQEIGDPHDQEAPPVRRSGAAVRARKLPGASTHAHENSRTPRMDRCLGERHAAPRMGSASEAGIARLHMSKRRITDPFDSARAADRASSVRKRTIRLLSWLSPAQDDDDSIETGHYA